MVIENLLIKQQTFKELDELCAPETILSADSSGLTIYTNPSRTMRIFSVDQAHRSRQQENSRLKRVVADLALDNAILEEVVEGNS